MLLGDDELVSEVFVIFFVFFDLLFEDLVFLFAEFHLLLLGLELEFKG